MGMLILAGDGFNGLEYQPDAREVRVLEIRCQPDRPCKITLKLSATGKYLQASGSWRRR